MLSFEALAEGALAVLLSLVLFYLSVASHHRVGTLWAHAWFHRTLAIRFFGALHRMFALLFILVLSLKDRAWWLHLWFFRMVKHHLRAVQLLAHRLVVLGEKLPHMTLLNHDFIGSALKTCLLYIPPSSLKFTLRVLFEKPLVLVA